MPPHTLVQSIGIPPFRTSTVGSRTEDADSGTRPHRASEPSPGPPGVEPLGAQTMQTRCELQPPGSELEFQTPEPGQTARANPLPVRPAWGHLARAPCDLPRPKSPAAVRADRRCKAAPPPPGGRRALRPVPPHRRANSPQSDATTRRRPTRRNEGRGHLPSARGYRRLVSKFRAAR